MRNKTEQHWLSPAMLRGFLNLSPRVKRMSAGEFAQLINKAKGSK